MCVVVIFGFNFFSWYSEKVPSQKNCMIKTNYQIFFILSFKLQFFYGTPTVRQRYFPGIGCYLFTHQGDGLVANQKTLTFLNFSYTHIGFIFSNSFDRMRSLSDALVGCAGPISFCLSRSILADSSLFISTWLCSISRCVCVLTVSYFRSSSAKLKTSLSSYSLSCGGKRRIWEREN